MSKIKPGDIVYLKTGSPAMTASSIARWDVWICKWFVGNKYQHEQFREIELTKEKPNLK